MSKYGFLALGMTFSEDKSSRYPCILPSCFCMITNLSKTTKAFSRYWVFSLLSKVSACSLLFQTKCPYVQLLNGLWVESCWAAKTLPDSAQPDNQPALDSVKPGRQLRWMQRNIHCSTSIGSYIPTFCRGRLAKNNAIVETIQVTCCLHSLNSLNTMVSTVSIRFMETMHLERSSADMTIVLNREKKFAFSSVENNSP